MDMVNLRLCPTQEEEGPAARADTSASTVPAFPSLLSRYAEVRIGLAVAARKRRHPGLCPEAPPEEQQVTEAARTEPTFSITLEGAALAPETVERIHRAVHRVVLAEIAEIDVAPSRAVRFIGIDRFPGGGQTQGIVAQIDEVFE
jgi:hypothetical protein